MSVPLIYPRGLTGAEHKSSQAAREEYVQGRNLIDSGTIWTRVASSEDAFDATVSALVMWEHRAQLAELVNQSDHVSRLEGAIWYPPWQEP
jgi:hypothetical protein